MQKSNIKMQNDKPKFKKQEEFYIFICHFDL